MARTNDFICDACGEFCTTVMIAGKLVPLVVYIVAGVPDDYPGQVDLNAPGVRVPEIIRALMRQPVPRKEFCVPCFAKTLGLELVEAKPTPALAKASVVH